MRLAGPVVGYRHEGVELAAQLADLAVGGGRLGQRPDLCDPLLQLGPLLQLFVLATV